MKKRIIDNTISVLLITLTGYFLVSVALVHFLKPELEFVEMPLSRYAVGEYGSYLTVGLYAMALAEIILSVRIFLRSNLLRSLSAVSLFISGMGVLLVGLFQMDMNNNETTQGMLHLIGAGIQFLFFPVATGLFSLSIKKGYIKFISAITGIMTLLFMLIIITVLVLEITEDIYVYGLIQKINILLISTWLLLISCINFSRI